MKPSSNGEKESAEDISVQFSSVLFSAPTESPLLTIGFMYRIKASKMHVAQWIFSMAVVVV